MNGPGDTHADKARDSKGRGAQEESGRIRGTQENCSATWLTVSGITVMGLVPQFSLAHCSDSRSFLVVHALLSQDGCQQGGFWEVAGHMAPPFDLSGTLTAGTGLLGPCSLQDLLF